MGKPNYRVLVSFDRDRNLFHARTHELEHLSGEGASRADAIAKLEEEIDAQLANMLSSGTAPPRALDDVEYSGEVQAKITRGLHRDLAHLARTEGVELPQLVGELLAGAMAVRQGSGRGVHKARGFASEPSDDIGNRADHGGNHRDGNHRDGNRRFGRGGMASGALDDRASFIEYVRGLDQTGPAGPPRSDGGPRGNGGPHGGHPGGGGRRHRRGGRGPQPGGPGRDGNRGHMGQGQGMHAGRGPQHGGHGAARPDQHEHQAHDSHAGAGHHAGQDGGPPPAHHEGNQGQGES
jgi:predicted HicB family RNase H-like nuclease